VNTDEVRANLRAIYEHSGPLYEAGASHLSLGDYQARTLEFLADDVILRNPESTPWGGTVAGKASVVAAMPRVQAAIGTRKVALRAVLVDGQHGLALVDLTYADDRGETAQTTVAEYFRFDSDGKVAEVIPHFFDTSAMLAFKNGESK
jgi:ketosteroid isomerase-like protein